MNTVKIEEGKSVYLVDQKGFLSLYRGSMTLKALRAYCTRHKVKEALIRDQNGMAVRIV